MKQKLTAQIGFLLCGCVVGATAAHFVARAIQLRTGRADLLSYANRLVQMGEQLDVEDAEAIAAVAHNKLSPCSDEDLAFMRDYVFQAPHIRDIGRTKDGKLYCTTGVGRLIFPKIMPAPDIDIDGLKIYMRIPLVISEKTTGEVVERSGVSLAFNFAFIKTFDEPPMHYTDLKFDRRHHRMFVSSGSVMPLSVDEVLAGKPTERHGVLYQPLCSASLKNCVVTSESRRDVLARSRWLVAGFLISGALLGGMLSMILIQVYQRQSSMENQLRRAVREGALTLVYHPVVDLETEAIVGAEALARWVDEDGAPVPPDIFVGLAEAKGFVGEITRLVAKRAVEEVGDLLVAGNLRVTINITAQELTDPGFFTYLEQCMAAANVHPSCIGLELTERSTADHETAVEAIAHLKSTGHMVYIDDFGTGYSSLAYLHRLNVDAIKIDRAFTQTVGTGAVTASVVPQILEMALRLDLLVVVEGIETLEQAEYFRGAGRGILAQGWLFGKPVSAAQFRQLLIEDSVRPSHSQLVS
jgi:sensor c-di-GMP phosphodiesterase-like protein